MSHSKIDAVVLGATGYVGGETLRLLSHHPVFELKAAVARSAVGQGIGQTFPHLSGVYAGTEFSAIESIEFHATRALGFVFLPAPRKRSGHVA